ncbi:MAG: YtxH domain-containing protein [Acidimicrobiia bacterium]|nr:YtxH domain-containing protein [Acidimicrobiia bacterium]MDX2467698.1 YtxH domain-containing protein [Acidimicrobiia bacterium]
MKLRTAIVFGIGYLLGAKAGRDRYEQLRRTYRRATSNEAVRKVIDQGKELVDTGTAQVRDVVAEQLNQAGDVIRERTEGDTA